MRVIPDKKVERLEFCEVHAKVWAEDPAAVGLTAEQCERLRVLTEQARAAREAAVEAREAARAAVTAQDAALEAAGRTAADLVRFVKAHAAAGGRGVENVVLAAAQIPPKAQAAPARAPGRPERLAVMLEPGGAVTLAWRAENAAAGTGAFFDVLRKLPGQTGFVPIGSTPGATGRSRTIRFTDRALPGGVCHDGAGAQYLIVGRRGTMTGPGSNAIAVRFGGGGGGGGGAGAETGEAGTLRVAA